MCQKDDHQNGREQTILAPAKKDGSRRGGGGVAGGGRGPTVVIRESRQKKLDKLHNGPGALEISRELIRGREEKCVAPAAVMTLQIYARKIGLGL